VKCVGGLPVGGAGQGGFIPVGGLRPDDLAGGVTTGAAPGRPRTRRALQRKGCGGSTPREPAADTGSVADVRRDFAPCREPPVAQALHGE